MPLRRTLRRGQPLWLQPACRAPRPLRPWLTDRGSLTARLAARNPTLSVRLLHQGWALPHRDELRAAGLPRRTISLCREVLLQAHAQLPLVFAHSVAGRAALRQGFGLLRRQGNRSLGSMLFAKPTVQRSALSWARLSPQHPLWRQVVTATGPQPRRLWARRSTFHLGRASLLVTEVFLPSLLISSCNPDGHS